MESAEFKSAVLDRSREIPVVVDFWAPWCAPCRALGPVIEALAEADRGRWELFKLNTDEQPEIAQRYGIQGIPAVKLFVDGEVRAEFVGALPQTEVRRWIDQHLPDATADALGEIESSWEERGPRIAGELESFLADHPDHPRARLRLAQALIGVDPVRARELTRHDTVDAELAEHVGVLADLVLLEPDDASAPLANALREASAALARHDLQDSLDHLVAAATIDPQYRDQLARRAAVALFHLLGQDHDTTREYRQRLAAALHS